MIALSLAVAGCNADEEDSIKENPYSGGREPLTVKLLSETPEPETAGPGTKVTFKAAGLAKYSNKDENKFDFEFYISDEQCEIAAATDSTLTIIIPENVSSGTTYLVLENQIFYGPYFNVSGSVSVDQGFEYYKTGPSYGSIFACVPWSGNTQQTTEFYLCGDFEQSKNSWYAGLLMVNNEKGLVNFGTANKFALKYGIYRRIYVNDGNTTSSYAAKLSGMDSWKADKESPKALLYGWFNDYERWSSVTLDGFNFRNVLLVNSDMTVLTEKRKFPDPDGNMKEINIPVFNGGTDMLNGIIRAFSTTDGKIIAVTNSRWHVYTDYENTTCSANGKAIIPAEIYTKIKSVMRMDEYGTLDLEYRRSSVNPEEEALPGADGEIKDACMTNDESIIIVGDLTAFDGKAINNIVKLDKDGIMDDTFSANVGAGADGEINKITYTSYVDGEGIAQERIVIVGAFTTFNGKSVPGLAVLNVDGTFDMEFELKAMEGGRPNFAKIVDLTPYSDIHKPHLVISGTFNKYAGITRQGFLILDMKGNAIQEFNVPGRFYGELYDVQYSLTSDYANGLLLTGDFTSFDGKRMNNIVMLKVDVKNVVNRGMNE
jgi:hypothetical protein bacD2_03784